MYPKIIIRDRADNFSRRWVGERHAELLGQRSQHMQEIRQNRAPPRPDTVYRAIYAHGGICVAGDDIINCFGTVPFVWHNVTRGQLVVYAFAFLAS